MNAMRGYDAWVTREPYWMDYEPPPPRTCGRCGKFIRETAEATVEYVTISRCTGEAKAITCRYDDGTHEGILDIIGEEYRDKTYQVAYPAACGTKDGKPNEHGDWPVEELGEISVNEVGDYTHEPHFFATPYDRHVEEIRTCKCGHVNREVQPF